jgi:hypothetical protein
VAFVSFVVRRVCSLMTPIAAAGKKESVKSRLWTCRPGIEDLMNG